MSGFAPYGNFWNYYTFNKVDERLQYINMSEVLSTMIEGKDEGQTKFSVLDVGCNEGDVSLAVRKLIEDGGWVEPQHLDMMGIDLDHELIQRAQKKAESAEGKSVHFVSDDFLLSNEPDSFLKANGQG